MPHHSSVFHGVLKHLPWDGFAALVEQHRGDFRVRRLNSKAHLITMLYGQLSGARSLREIELGLRSQSARLYHLGGREVRRSTLADANAQRDHKLFAELFAMMVRNHRGSRRAMGEAVHLIDSTTISLSALSGWARFSKDEVAAKLHLVLDADANQPLHADITPSRVNDITAAHAMPIQPGATYVFDLGYYQFAWWAKLDQAGCRIVTRLKANTPLREATERPLPETVPGGSTILSDRVGRLPRHMAAGRRNAFDKPVREVRVQLETGKVLRVMSNDLDAPARQIADLYKRRWAIELFFRWVKQTLRINHFLGTSENAVRIQIITALIAHMLLRMAHGTQTAIENLTAFARLACANLMHRRRLDRLLSPQPAHHNSHQMTLALT